MLLDAGEDTDELSSRCLLDRVYKSCLLGNGMSCYDEWTL